MENYTIEHLNSLNLKHYSQTCSNNLLYKTTNTESTQANSCTIITVQGHCLSNMNSNHFFCLPNEKKNLSKTTTTKLYPAKECEKIIRNMCKKYLSLWLYFFYCKFITQSLLNVYESWTIYKIIQKYVK